jgi:hypothetical protein
MPEEVTSQLDTLTDLTTPWCVRVAVTLRIPELIEQGTATAAALAAETGCDAEAISRLLQHLASKGVLQEAPYDAFTLGATGRRLLDESARLLLDLNGIGDRYARIWSGLFESMRTGASVYHKVFGLPFWQDLEQHPAIADSYDQVNGPLGHPAQAPDFDVCGGWESITTVVHLGGDIGGDLAELLRVHPHLHGTLVDFPRVVAGAPEVFESAGVAERATTAGQSFFAPLPAGADLYLIKGVMRVWSDPVAVRLLKRCAEALGPHGRLILLDDVLPDGHKDANEGGYEQLLTLMVGGKDARKRTLSEFSELARKAGLAVTASAPQPPWPFVVECRSLVVPAAELAPSTREPLNQLLTRLGYRTVGERWNDNPLPADPRADLPVAGAPPGERAACAAAAQALRGRILTRQQNVMPEIIDRWPAVAGRGVTLVVQTRGGEREEVSCRFAAATAASPAGDSAAVPGPAIEIAGNPETWLSVLSGRSSFPAQMTTGGLRQVRADRTTRLRPDELRAIAVLLGLATTIPVSRAAGPAGADPARVLLDGRTLNLSP